jgi:hypothetical protein
MHQYIFLQVKAENGGQPCPRRLVRRKKCQMGPCGKRYFLQNWGTNFASKKVDWFRDNVRDFSIWEAFISNLGQNTGYSDCGLSGISSAPSGKCWDSTTDQAMTVSFQILSNLLCTSHPTIQHYTEWDTKSIINFGKETDLCRAHSELAFCV